MNKTIWDPEQKEYLYFTAYNQDKYVHKKHKTEFIAKKFDIHSKKESKRNFQVDIRTVNMKEISKPYESD